MKKVLLLFIFSIFSRMSIQAQSNNYHPFPTANAIWSEYNNLSGNIIKYQYGIFGDTVINNLTFHKLYQHQIICMDSSISPANSTYIGALTEDSLKRVYFFNTAYTGPCVSLNQMYKLYDFSKQNIGDTIQFDANMVPFCYNYPALTISNIDSVIVNNAYRKRFHFAEGEVWIEGIGSTRHLLSVITPFPTCSCITELLCHKQNNMQYFINPTYNYCFCNLGVAMEGMTIKKLLRISPNPSQQFIIIEKHFEKNSYYKIYNYYGILILSGSLTKSEHTIPIETLNNGFYFLEMETEYTKFEVIK